MLAWRRIIDFFQLRPFFTAWSLRIAWWVYIWIEADRLYRRSTATLAIDKYDSVFKLYKTIELVIGPLTICIGILTARLMLELSVRLIWPSLWAGNRRGGQGSPWQALIAFLDVGPFFTPRRLQVFWILFLLTMAQSCFEGVIFGLFPLEYMHVRDWLSLAYYAFLVPLAYIFGVRLLVEAALFSMRPPTDLRSASIEP